ncbi:hypothetical protein MKW92_032711 [Papaver armeniacum]|nr:hypothetical protein MKW92_032711 [Papaver armeniacum]
MKCRRRAELKSSHVVKVCKLIIRFHCSSMGGVLLQIHKLGEVYFNQKFGDKALEEQVLIEQKCNQERRPLYQKRNEIVKTIPKFWFLAFLSHYALGDLFGVEDQKIFRFLNSMDVKDEEDVMSGYMIILNFNNNPYFSNQSLTKRISFCEDGTTNLTAVTISWKVNMDISTEYQHHTPLTNASFFTWFCAPQVISKVYHDEVTYFFFSKFCDHSFLPNFCGHYFCFYVSELIKDELWPNAVEYFLNFLYFRGYQGNESDEEDEQPKGIEE